MKIILFEDDFMVRRQVEAICRRLIPDVQLTALASADDLEAKFGTGVELGEIFDVIISDIFLSGDKTGLDLMMSLPEGTQRRSIVCSTVKVDRAGEFIRQRRLKCQFVSKPLNEDEFECAIRRACDLSGDPVLVRGLPKVRAAKPSVEPVILITGCSSGIGEAVGEKLVWSRKYRVILTARTDSLERIRERFQESSRLMLLPLDVTDEEMVKKTLSQIVRRWGKIDVLINNAGSCYRSVVEHMDSDAELAQLKTNYLGPMNLIRLVTPIMREQGRGKIINVSSVSGILGMPTMASYAASKHALEGASESLWYELRPFGINVSVVRPGFINSDGYQRVSFANKANLARKLEGPYADFYRFMSALVGRLMRVSPGTSDSVAEKIVDVLQTQNPPLWVNATADAHFFAFLKRLVPAFLFHRVVYAMFARRAEWGREYSRADPERLRA